jgi:hypothetical protein
MDMERWNELMPLNEFPAGTNRILQESADGGDMPNEKRKKPVQKYSVELTGDEIDSLRIALMRWDEGSSFKLRGVKHIIDVLGKAHPIQSSKKN